MKLKNIIAGSLIVGSLLLSSCDGKEKAYVQNLYKKAGEIVQKSSYYINKITIYPLEKLIPERWLEEKTSK